MLRVHQKPLLQSKYMDKSNNTSALSRFLGTFAKLRKVTFSFIMSALLSVRPSDRTEQLGSHWTDFNEI